jgi:D-glycero-alpha-D-manno-heptose-7-phosphate kinase
MIMSRTPLRISFAGGGTDLPSFYRKHGFGAVFSTSIDKYIYVSVKKHCELYSEKIRLNYSGTEQINTLYEIQNPIIRECLRFLEIDDRIYISTVADAPASSGLGSSSTFCVGLLNALYAFRGEKASRGKLAEEAAHIEIDVLKRPMGKQDHYAAAYGGMNYIRFDDNENTSIMPLSARENITEKILSYISTYWTGIERNSETILAEQNEKNDHNSDVLLQMRSQALALYDLANKGNLGIQKIGEILHEGWLMKRSLASKISNPFISNAYDKALENGALGGKISGAGGGGFLLLLVPVSKKSTVDAVMKNMGLIQFPLKPDFEGTTVTSIK